MCGKKYIKHYLTCIHKDANKYTQQYLHIRRLLVRKAKSAAHAMSQRQGLG